MRLFKSLSTAFLLVTGVAIHFNSAVSSAIAAGFDPPNRDVATQHHFNASVTQSTCEDATVRNGDSHPTSESVNQHQPCPLTLEWNTWSTPYTQADGNACRELSGNLVCVTPDSANHLRW